VSKTRLSFAAAAAAAAALMLALAGLAGCTTPNGSAVITVTKPTEVGFADVAQLLEHKCGTLDCHGTVGRNLRIFGDEGLRYAASDQPCVPAETTTREVQEDYDSLVGLEPEEMSNVVANHGADPEQLSFIAKPLGIESHMGGTVFSTGDDTYTCLTSWLAGSTNTQACLSAMPATYCGVPAADSFDAGASFDAGGT
jgi:hypothetical protein